MEAFPAFFPLKGRRVVLAGEGEAAETKARLLAGSPARLDRPGTEAALRPRTYAGAALAFVASPDAAFCEAASAAAREVGVPVNVTDHPELSDFHTPAIVDRGQVVAAVGTAGAAPALAALVRAELEARLPLEMGALAGLFGELRAEIRAAFPDLARRRAFFRAALVGPAAEAVRGGDLDEAQRRLKAEIAAGSAPAGAIWLIETPARRDLLSLAAARALAEAELVVCAEGIDPEIPVLARRDAPRRALKDTDASALSALAADGTSVAVVASPGQVNALADALKPLGAAVLRLAPAPDA
jgi:precorrin-2 dehydrogenase / sirohydrochlorin ferrochelatase